MSICKKTGESDILAGELKKHRLEACTGQDEPCPPFPNPSCVGGKLGHGNVGCASLGPLPLLVSKVSITMITPSSLSSFHLRTPPFEWSHKSTPTYRHKIKPHPPLISCGG